MTEAAHPVYPLPLPHRRPNLIPTNALSLTVPQDFEARYAYLPYSMHVTSLCGAILLTLLRSTS